MKKVLQFLPALPMGGAETLVKDYCLGLDKLKFNVSVLCLKKINSSYEKLLEKSNIRLNFISEKVSKNFVKKIFLIKERIFYIRNYLKINQPDIIHVHLAINIYLLFCHIPKTTKLFLTIHTEPSVLWKKNRIDFFVVKYLIKYKNLQLITLHEGMKNEVDRLFGIDNSMVLNNGVNIEKFNIPIDKMQIRKKLGIPENAFVIGHVGRFESVKNHSFLLDVFKYYYENNKNSFLLMIGTGSTEQQVKEKIINLRLSDKVLILSNRTDIPELLKCMDFFVFPSTYEGFRIVLIEAQIAGIKCLASDAIPIQTCISNLIKYKSLSDSPMSWAENLKNWPNEAVKYDKIDDWNMKNVILKLQRFYGE